MSVYKLNEAINDYNLRLGEYTDSLSTHIKLHVTEKYSEAECLDMEPLITMLTGYIIKSGLYEDVVFHLDKAEDIREVTKQSKAYFVETIMSQYISGDMICEAIEKEVVDFTFFVLELASINHLESIGKLDSVEEEETPTLEWTLPESLEEELLIPQPLEREKIQEDMEIIKEYYADQKEEIEKWFEKEEEPIEDKWAPSEQQIKDLKKMKAHFVNIMTPDMIRHFFGEQYEEGVKNFLDIGGDTLDEAAKEYVRNYAQHIIKRFKVTYEDKPEWDSFLHDTFKIFLNDDKELKVDSEKSSLIRDDKYIDDEVKSWIKKMEKYNIA